MYIHKYGRPNAYTVKQLKYHLVYMLSVEHKFQIYCTSQIVPISLIVTKVIQ